MEKKKEENKENIETTKEETKETKKSIKKEPSKEETPKEVKKESKKEEKEQPKVKTEKSKKEEKVKVKKVDSKKKETPKKGNNDSKKEEKLSFSNIEIIFMVVMVALVILAGTVVFTLTTRNRNINNFKEDSIKLIGIATNAHAKYTIHQTPNVFTSSTDGTEKGMCITINGLRENGFPVDLYKDWDGYIVIEEDPNKQITTSIWATNKKFVINGYTKDKINELDFKDGITKYNNDSFSTKVKTSYTGTSGEKGGTGSLDGSVLKKYENKCINGKIG